MKGAFWKSLYALVWGAGICVLCYFGWFRNIEWASNIAQFVLWIGALLSCLVASIYLILAVANEEGVRKTAKPVPWPSKWVTRPFAVTEIGLCVASGHWVLGIFVMTGCILIAWQREVSLEMLKPANS